jgi:hypothetical protein
VAALLALPAAAGAQPAPAEADSPAVPSEPEPVPSATGQFTTAVEDREPVDQITFVSTDVRRVFFFSDLRGLEGQTVVHRWRYGSDTVAEVPFEVRGPRWRVWSSKELVPDWIGDWTVEVVAESGEVIATETFTYAAPGS